MVEVLALGGMPEVVPGMDLAALLADALEAAAIRPGRHDVLVVTQKIVSKAEGRFLDLRAVTPGVAAGELAAKTGKDPRFVEAVLGESAAVVRAAPNVLITRHRSGHVMANAGIDRSNMGPADAADDEDRVLLLPLDADASALRLREALAGRLGEAPAVVISDSFGRPWRIGTVNVAIGAAGIPAVIDQRGDHDRDGRVLQVTQVALADMVASAAGLVAGEAAEGIPAVLVRGLAWTAPDTPAAAALRPAAEDLFA